MRSGARHAPMAAVHESNTPNEVRVASHVVYQLPLRLETKVGVFTQSLRLLHKEGGFRYHPKCPLSAVDVLTSNERVEWARRDVVTHQQPELDRHVVRS